MCRKKKNVSTEPQVEKPVNPLDTVVLKKPEPVYDENGGRDYFAEYYNAYKNDYIDQYYEAYKKFKEQGRVGEILADSNDQEPVAATATETPSTEAVTTENNAEHEESHEKLSDLD